MIKSYPRQASPAELDGQEQYFERLGVFDPMAYTNSSKSLVTLIDLIRRLRNRGAKVLLVLMPEHSRIQRRTPADALRVLHASLERAFPNDTPHFVDLRSSEDDAAFVDLSQSQSGRKPALQPAAGPDNPSATAVAAIADERVRPCQSLRSV